MQDQFYEPSTGRTFATVGDFRLAYPHTSFGDLDNEDERNAFGLYRVLDVRPAHDPRTQVLVEIEPAVINGLLHRQWRVDPRSPEEIARVVEAKVEALWQAADRYTSGYISGVAVGILTIGVMQQKPKALAVSAWSSAVWAEYYARKAFVTATSADDHDFSSFGNIPHTVPELQAEVGL